MALRWLVSRVVSAEQRPRHTLAIATATASRRAHFMPSTVFVGDRLLCLTERRVTNDPPPRPLDGFLRAPPFLGYLHTSHVRSLILSMNSFGGFQFHQSPSLAQPINHHGNVLRQLVNIVQNLNRSGNNSGFFGVLCKHSFEEISQR